MENTAGNANTTVSSVGTSPSQSSMAYGNPGAMNQNTTQFLSNFTTTERGVGAQIVNHYNVQPVFDIYANVDRQDLGSVGRAVEKNRQRSGGQPSPRHLARRPRSDPDHGDRRFIASASA